MEEDMSLKWGEVLYRFRWNTLVGGWYLDGPGKPIWLHRSAFEYWDARHAGQKFIGTSAQEVLGQVYAWVKRSAEETNLIFEMGVEPRK